MEEDDESSVRQKSAIKAERQAVQGDGERPAMLYRMEAVTVTKRQESNVFECVKCIERNVVLFKVSPTTV